jgi:soluble lytic murein transglycosylase-like protein
MIKAKLKPLSISIMVNILLVILVMFLVWKTIQIKQVTQSEMIAVLNQNDQELENFRADIRDSIAENMVFFKIILLKPYIDKGLARSIAHSLVMWASEYKRDPDLVLALIEAESNFQPHVISPTGARGLMQIMPLWKNVFDIDRELWDIDTNIKCGLKILNIYQEMFGSLELALTAYNRGPTVVRADMQEGRVPFNGYSDTVLKVYARVKSWDNP